MSKYLTSLLLLTIGSRYRISITKQGYDRPSQLLVITTVEYNHKCPSNFYSLLSLIQFQLSFTLFNFPRMNSLFKVTSHYVYSHVKFQITNTLPNVPFVSLYSRINNQETVNQRQLIYANFIFCLRFFRIRLPSKLRLQIDHGRRNKTWFEEIGWSKWNCLCNTLNTKYHFESTRYEKTEEMTDSLKSRGIVTIIMEQRWKAESFYRWVKGLVPRAATGINKTFCARNLAKNRANFVVDAVSHGFESRDTLIPARYIRNPCIVEPSNKDVIIDVWTS